MEEAITEFYIPMNIADLENAEKLQNLAPSGVTPYFVSETLDVCSIAQNERAATLNAILHEIAVKGATSDPTPLMIFKNPETFDSIYSFVKELDNPGIIPRECRSMLGTELAQLLLKLKKMVEGYLRRPSREESQHEAVMTVCRSSFKMYIYLLCQVLCGTVSDDGNSASQQSQAQQRKQRKQRMAMTEEDMSGLDVSTRENSLRAILEALSPVVANVWRGGQVESSVSNLALKTVFFMLSRKSNVQGDDNPIADGLIRLLGCLIQLYTQNLITAQQRQAAEGATGALTVLSPKDFIVSPLVDFLMKASWSAKCCSKLVKDFVDVADTEQTWAPVFLATFYEAVASAAINDAPTDSQAAKNIAAFVDQESSTHLTAIFRYKDSFIPLICSESYEIRKSGLTALMELIIQKYAGATRNAEEEEIRNAYLKDLLSRMRDLNPFVRSHCTKLWIQLFELKAVPRAFYQAIVHEAVGRLTDRHPLVRSKACALLETCIRKSWFSASLSLSHIQARHNELLTAARGKFQTDAEFEVAVDAARSAAQEMREVQQDGGDADVNRIVLYEATIDFIKEFHVALERAVEMLNSRVLQDVTSAISLITVCSEYRLDPAPDAVRRLLVMIFVQEPKVQQAVCDAFILIFFEAFSKVTASALTRNLARVQKLLIVLKDASEGEVCSIERIIATLKAQGNNFLSESLLDAVWGVIDNSLGDNCTPEDRRTAMRLFAILTSCMPKDIMARIGEVLHIIRANPTDNILLAHAFTAVQHQASVKGYVPIPDNVNINTHPTLSLLMHHLCRPTRQLGTWIRMADSAIHAIHSLCMFPVVYYMHAAAFIANAFVESGETDESRLAQLFFILGSSAMKHLVSIDNYERRELKRLDELPTVPAGRSSGEKLHGELDQMQRELGVGTNEFKRHELQENCVVAKNRMLDGTDQTSIWYKFAPLIVRECSRKIPTSPIPQEKEFLRTGSILALLKLMVASHEFCEQNLQLVFTLLSSQSESWVNKCNIVIGLGDLACIHPNLLQPYMKLENGFYSLLADPDPRVRRTAIQVCTHLVLNDMLRPNDYLHTIVRLVADPIADIAQTAEMFVQHLASKYRGHIGNFIPPLVAKLSPVMSEDKFEVALKALLERVEKDKATESLVEKLCDRFPRFTEEPDEVALSRNIAFSLCELQYASERAIRLLLSERCYAKYKSWLRCPPIFRFFQQIASKAKRSAGVGERRDKAMIDEWEQRLAMDSTLFPRGEEDDDDDDESNESESESSEGSEENAQEQAPVDAPPASGRSSGGPRGQTAPQEAESVSLGSSSDEESQSSSSVEEEEEEVPQEVRRGRGRARGCALRGRGRGRGRSALARLGNQ